MQSTSASDGTYTSDRHFRDRHRPRRGEILVQNRVSAAISSLPAEVQIQGVTTQRKSTSILEFVGLRSPDGRFDSLFLSNYAVINVQNELARLNGVGDVSVFGAGQYAMRIWLDPDLMQARGLTPQDVINIDPAAEPGSRRRPDRRAARAEGPGFPIYAEPQWPPGRCGRLREHHRQGRRPQMAAASRACATSAASSSARRPTANRSISTAGRRPASASPCCPRPTRSRSPMRSRPRWTSSRRASPRASNMSSPYDTTKFVKAAINEV